MRFLAVAAEWGRMPASGHEIGSPVAMAASPQLPDILGKSRRPTRARGGPWRPIRTIQQVNESRTTSPGCRNLIILGTRNTGDREWLAFTFVSTWERPVNNNSADLKISQTLSNNRIKRRDVVVSGGSLLAASALMGGALLPATSRPAKAQATAATSTAVPADLIGDIATSAYIYAYPLIFMEMMRRIGTNVADTRQFARAPMNRFANVPAFPDATFTDVTRANVDTLYSLMWFDVSQEPLLISVADSGGASICCRCATCGLTCSTARVSAPPEPARRCWRLPGQAGKASFLRKLPSFIAPRRSAGSSGAHRPTARSTTTLSQWNKPYQPPAGRINPDWDIATPPITQVEKLGPAAYFSLFAELTALNPPHANDYPILHQMRRIGIEPGKPFAFDRVSPEIQRALTDAGPAALNTIKARLAKAGVANAGWRTNLNWHLRRGLFEPGGGRLCRCRRQHDRRRRLSDRVYRCRGQAVQQRQTLPSAFQQGSDTAGTRLLVADDVQRKAAARGQSDRPLCYWRPRQARIQSRWLTRCLHSARVTRQRQRVELAAGSREWLFHDEHAALLAQG
jgi:hypothetical protein